MIILGIDPGLANTGWGVIETSGSRFRCVAYGCVTTDGTMPLPARLNRIHQSLCAVADKYRPDEAAIESVYFSNNARSAFATGQARGVAILAAHGLPLGEYGPGEIKLAVVGAGDADKHQVQYMVRVVLGLKDEPKPDHAADALAAAICHANSRARAALSGTAL